MPQTSNNRQGALPLHMQEQGAAHPAAAAVVFISQGTQGIQGILSD